MGVDWYSCKHCGETFPDCGDYEYCDCGKHWCSLECAEADGYRIDKEENDEYEKETSCKYCRKEDFNDSTLLKFALGIIGINREDLIENYKLNFHK